MPKVEIVTKSGKRVIVEFAQMPSAADIDEVAQQIETASAPAQRAGSASSPAPAQSAGLVQRIWQWLNKPRPNVEQMAMASSEIARTASDKVEKVVQHDVEANRRMIEGFVDVPHAVLESVAQSLLKSPAAQIYARITGLEGQRQQALRATKGAPPLHQLAWSLISSPITSLWQTVSRPREAYEEKGATGMLLDVLTALGLGSAAARTARAALKRLPMPEALAPAPASSAATAEEAGAGALVSRGAVRVQPAPAPEGATPAGPQQLVQTMQEVSGKAVRLTRTAPRGAAGAYEPAQTRVQVRRPTDPLTAAHEIAHYWDDKYGVLKQWANPRVKSPYDDEVFQLPGVPQKGKLAERRAEALSRFVEVYVQNPSLAQQIAPNFYKFLRDTLPDAEWDALDQFSGQLRAYLALPPEQQTALNVRFWWDKPTLKERLQGLLQPKIGRFSTWKDVLRREFTDEYAPLVRATEAAAKAKGLNLKPSQNPAVLLRLWHGFNEKFHDILENGVPQMQQGRITGRATGGLDWLLAPAQGRDLSEVQQMMRDATAYEVALRTLELSKRFGREDNLTGIGAGVRSDLEQAKRTLINLSNHPRLKDIAEMSRRYRQWADAVLRYAVDKGRLSPETYRRIRDANMEYVALQRDMLDWNARHFGDDLRDLFGEEAPTGGGRVGSEKYVTKRIKGSSRQIKDPVMSLLLDSYRILREADRNEVMRAFVDVIKPPDRKMYGANADLVSFLETIGRKVSSQEPGAVKIYRKGEAEYWQFDPLIAESIKGFMNGFDSALLRIASLPASVFRDIVTHSPAFILRNVLRDMQHRHVISEVNSKLWDSFAKQDPATLSKARQYGALGGGYYFRSERDYYTALKEAMLRLATRKDVLVLDPTRALNWWHELSAKSEYAGRLAEFRRAFEHAKRMGYDDHDAAIYAAYMARDLLDFARAGRVVRFINRFIPFTNANVQGVIRTARAIATNPQRTLARWAAVVALPEMMVYAWNRFMGAEKEYREFPAYARDMFHLIKIAPDLWISIPKPFEVGVLGGAVQRALHGDFDGYAGSVAKAWLPLGEEALIGGVKPMDTVAELIANYDFFRGRNIVPPWENDLRLELRSTENASRLARALQAVAGVDARKIDHVIKAYGAGWGNLLTEATTPPVHWQNILSKATGLARQTPAGESRSLQDLYEMMSRSGMTMNRYQRMLLQRLLTKAREGKTAQEREQAKQALHRWAQVFTQIYKQREQPTIARKLIRKDVRQQQKRMD
jgi:hypothetical protein